MNTFHEHRYLRYCGKMVRNINLVLAHDTSTQLRVHEPALRLRSQSKIVAQEAPFGGDGGLCCARPPDEHTIWQSEMSRKGTAGDNLVPDCLFS